MLINSFTSIFLLFVFTCISVNSETVVRNYVVRKDFLADIKKREFDIFDQTESTLQYYIEAKRNFGEKIEIIAAPSKQVVAKLKRNISFMYKATISVLDPRSNRWIDGKIKQNMRVAGSKYTIEWNGEKVVMKTIFGTLSTEFRDEKNGIPLAEFRKRLSSLVSVNKYDLKVYSNKLPDAMYLLIIAVHDYNFEKQGSD